MAAAGKMAAAGRRWLPLAWLALGALASDMPHYMTVAPGFFVAWDYDMSSQEATFAVEAATLGWVGIGLSPNGGMDGADMATAWIKDGKPYFHDRHGVGTEVPVIDESQDYTLISLRQNGTHTLLKFKRPFRTCDPRDIDITGSTLKLIYACSASVPGSPTDMPYHETVAGVRSFQLLNYGRKTLPTVSNSDALTITTNVTVPRYHTFYACQLEKFPDFGRKVHVYMFESIVTPQEATYVHHTLLYLCPAVYNDSMLSPARNCFENDYYTRLFMGCGEILTGWAVGGNQLVIYPDDVGFSLGAPGDPKYFVLQIHYDNPAYTVGVQDFSGFKLHYTTDLQRYDAGVLWAGLMISGTHLIPPAASDYKSYGYCDLSPADKEAETEYPALNVFGGILHTHLLGSKVRVLQFRDGKLLRVLMEDQHYDFNLQEWRSLEQPVAVLRGDKLITECTYKSKDRKTMTWGGLSTQQEMCLAFLMYYPRIDVVSCMSMVPTHIAATALNVSAQTEEELIGQLSLWNWTQDLAKEMEQKMRSVAQSAIVVTRTEIKTIPVEIPTIPDEKPVPCVRKLLSGSPRHTARPVLLLLGVLVVCGCRWGR